MDAGEVLLFATGAAELGALSRQSVAQISHLPSMSCRPLSRVCGRVSTLAHVAHMSRHPKSSKSTKKSFLLLTYCYV
jgi:hypothetical protein